MGSLAAVGHPFLDAVQPVVEALGSKVVSGPDAGVHDIPLLWEGEVVGAVQPPDLHGALDRLVLQVEKELGAPLAELSREDKQRAVRSLEQRGAFHLRKSVEEVAAILHVSRFTVYNYLDRE
jgi:hypothetical protein